MAKGYWVARVDVSDPDGYQQYVKQMPSLLQNSTARFLVRGGAYQVPEGCARSRNVVIEFDSHRAALDCYYSPEYQAAKALRADAAESDLLIIEGYDGNQPGD
jgi:uncharacterized protein (DUF1330 family)